MCQNQLGKRNLTEAQKTYLIGKEYEAKKMTQGGDRKSDDFSSVQNGNLKSETGKTAQKIADDNKIGYGTVIRAEQFSSGLDAAEAVSPGIKDAVLTGEFGRPQSGPAPHS